MATITLSRVADLAALEAPWRALEQRSPGGFFKGWTWTGCLAAQRFGNPLLLRAEQQGRTVALALFNCRPAWRGPARLTPVRLHLGESGEPALDAVFVEHNGPLIEAGHEALLAPLLAAALTLPLPGTLRHGRALVLGGVGDAVLQAARSLAAGCHVRQLRVAPFVDLAALPPGGLPDALGASTRYQLRRSARRYAGSGALLVRRAADVAEALAYFDALAALHQTTWIARGAAGAFADPAILTFHRTLIARGVPRAEVDLLRVTAGDRPIGYLYNFLAGPPTAQRWVGNYQGGFDYAVEDPHCKPGLTCHHIAIEFYRAEGRHIYDLLAGDSRYKTSLAQNQTPLHWLEVVPSRSLPGVLGSAQRGLAGMRRLRRLLR